MKEYKAIVFDIDNTLLNTMEMNMYPLIRIIKEERNEDWTYEQVLRFATQPGMKTMEELGIQDKEKTYKRWVRYVSEWAPRALPYEGMEAVLQKLQRSGIRLAVVSSKMQDQYQTDMVENGFHRYMETAVLVEDTVNHKPHPEPILKCLERLQLEAGDVLYVGDAYTDMLAARAAGVDYGFARWGSIYADQIQDADYVFSQPEDLLQLLIH